MSKASNISQRQNSEPYLSRLAAFSIFYQRAKIVAAIQFAFTMPMAIVSAGIIAYEPKVKVWTTFFALTVALLDALVLERIQNYFRKMAARTQEQFDCDLFNLDWRSLRVGEKPEPGDVIHAANRFKKTNPQMGHLKDWYPPAVDKVPLSLARLICQRTNCWWDSSLRKKYANALIAILLLIIVTVIVIALFQHQTVEQMILSVYAPIAPAVLWTVREVRRQHDAAEALDKLRGHVQRIWASVLKGQPTRLELDAAAREIQDSLYDGRSKNPLIFDWINNWVRPSHEISMNAKADEMIAEVIGSEKCAKYT
jgi:SMODS-associating 4TM effector domain